MKKIIIMAAMAIVGIHAQAQIVSSRSAMTTRQVVDEPKSYNGWSTFGVEYLPSSWSGDGDSESFSAFALNYSSATSLTSSIPLFLEWGLGAQYSSKSIDDNKIHYASLKVPVNVIYDFQIPNTKINIDPYLGIKFRGNVWGEYKDYEDESYNLFGDDLEWKRFQVGFNIGVKARFNNSFFIGIAYGSDFNEIAEDIKVNELSISAGLVF